MAFSLCEAVMFFWGFLLPKRKQNQCQELSSWEKQRVCGRRGHGRNPVRVGTSAEPFWWAATQHWVRLWRRPAPSWYSPSRTPIPTQSQIQNGPSHSPGRSCLWCCRTRVAGRRHLVLTHHTRTHTPATHQFQKNRPTYSQLCDCILQLYCWFPYCNNICINWNQCIWSNNADFARLAMTKRLCMTVLDRLPMGTQEMGLRSENTKKQIVIVSKNDTQQWLYTGYSALPKLTFLILRTALRDRSYYYLHFTKENMDAQRQEINSPNITNSKVANKTRRSIMMKAWTAEND